MNKTNLTFKPEDIKDNLKLFEIVKLLNDKINELIEDNNKFKENQPGIIKAKV